MKIKIYPLVFLLVSFLRLIASAQCPAEPTMAETERFLTNQKFDVTHQSEVYLSFDASGGGTAWDKESAQAAVLTVFVDGKYNQDVILFAGATKFNYRVLLGGFDKGKHDLAIALNKPRSALNAKEVQLSALVILPVSLNVAKEETSEQHFAALLNTPIIYARPDTVDRFSDIPLVTYYEILPTSGTSFKIRYTTIFTNEDGGTQSAALMARWGRMTDIEWIYEIEVKDREIISAIYQGANHETKNFTGKRVFGNHPLIFDTTVNNNFADTGCSALRFAPLPVKADLSNGSRETVMDTHSWTYRIMAEEAAREGRINPDNLGANTIDDLRNYWFVETYSESGKAKVSLEITDDKNRQSTSDFNDARLRVDRSGYFRIAVRLPDAASKPISISLQCRAANSNDGNCQNARVIKILRLDKNFIPREVAFETKPAANLKQGETAIYKIKH